MAQTEYYDSLINKLTAGEIVTIVAYYRNRYQFETNDRGCEIMGKKLKPPRKRGGKFPIWKPLARKEGYLQVTCAGLDVYYRDRGELKGDEVFKTHHPRRSILCNSKLQLQKVLWHQLCWRHDHDFALIPKAKQCAHRCGVRDCGTTGHIILASPELNEEHKQCKYLYATLNGQKKLFLHCIHEPQCIPPLSAVPMKLVTDQSVINTMKYV